MAFPSPAWPQPGGATRPASALRFPDSFQQFARLPSELETRERLPEKREAPEGEGFPGWAAGWSPLRLVLVDPFRQLHEAGNPLSLGPIEEGEPFRLPQSDAGVGGDFPPPKLKSFLRPLASTPVPPLLGWKVAVQRPQHRLGDSCSETGSREGTFFTSRAWLCSLRPPGRKPEDRAGGEMPGTLGVMLPDHTYAPIPTRLRAP